MFANSRCCAKTCTVFIFLFMIQYLILFVTILIVNFANCNLSAASRIFILSLTTSQIMIVVSILAKRYLKKVSFRSDDNYNSINGPWRPTTPWVVTKHLNIEPNTVETLFISCQVLYQTILQVLVFIMFKLLTHIFILMFYNITEFFITWSKTTYSSAITTFLCEVKEIL